VDLEFRAMIRDNRQLLYCEPMKMKMKMKMKKIKIKIKIEY